MLSRGTHGGLVLKTFTSWRTYLSLQGLNPRNRSRAEQVIMVKWQFVIAEAIFFAISVNQYIDGHCREFQLHHKYSKLTNDPNTRFCKTHKHVCVCTITSYLNHCVVIPGSPYPTFCLLEFLHKWKVASSPLQILSGKPAFSTVSSLILRFPLRVFLWLQIHPLTWNYSNHLRTDEAGGAGRPIEV